jgi:hypothetical protein
MICNFVETAMLERLSLCQILATRRPLTVSSKLEAHEMIFHPYGLQES